MGAGETSKSPGIHLPTVAHRPFTTVGPFISTSNATKEGSSRHYAVIYPLLLEL